MSPRFSIAVPTRDRPETLPFAIRSVLSQDFADLELVVCDNSTTERAAELLAGFSDPRLKVVRTAGDLSMSHNWELALSRCRGEFVSFLGDDDALVPHALLEVDRLLRRTKARALRWDFATYTWPSVPSPADGGVLLVPLARSLTRVDGRERFARVGALPTSYPLPMVLHGAVERRLLEELRAASGGAFFRGLYPDVYSGFAIAARVGEFWESTLPLTVAGLSGSSTGISLLFDHAAGTTPSRVRDAFHGMSARGGVAPHPRVPKLATIPSIVLDSWSVARDRHLPDLPELEPRHVARALLESITAGDPARQREEEALVRASLHRPDDRTWFDDLARSCTERPAPTIAPRWRGQVGDRLALDAGRLGVRDVEAAATLTGVLVGLEASEVRYDQPARDELVDQVERERAALLRSLSWRLTSPLRRGGALVARLGRRLPGS